MSVAVAFTGTKRLLRASLKYNGRLILPWIALATILSASSVLVYPLAFPAEQDRLVLATGIGANPAISLIFGPAFDLMTTDGFNVWRSLAIGGFLIGLMAIFAVIKGSRAQEDSGQAELLASGVLGRSSRLASAVGLAFLGSLLAGVIVGGATIACGGAVEPSLLLGATFTATGWMCASLAGVTAQLGSEARTSTMVAVAFLGVLFLLRGLSYSMQMAEWTIWANPLGWMTETRPAAGNYWWPLLLAVALSLVMLGIAFALQARRDFGQGVIPSRPGAARAKHPGLVSFLFRLNAGSFIAWSVAFVALGSVFGYFTTSITDILVENTQVASFLAAGVTTPSELTSAFLVTIFSLMGIIASVAGVQIMLRVRTEEIEDRLEPVLATTVSRWKHYVTNISIALLAPSIYVLIAGTLMALIASSADIGVEFGKTFLQALATIPAVWAVVSVAVFVVGVRPKVSLAAWLGTVASFGLTLLGPTFKLPDWALGISPFWHVPNVSVSSPDYSGLVWVIVGTMLICLVGLVGFRRRDIARV